MKVKNIGSNQSLVQLNNGVEVLVSYETPVACFIPGKGYFQSETKYSKTTSKHINTWIGWKGAPTMPQAKIEALMGK